MGVEVQIYNPSTAKAEEGSSESPEASVIYTVNPRPLRLHTETLSQKTESREKKITNTHKPVALLREHFIKHVFV